jgi:ribonucleoside-diphosphate reductase beta chain
MSKDRLHYFQLSENEKDAFKNLLSFLIFLDSIQTNNLAITMISQITAPEVVMCIAQQISMEAVHTASYQYILESIFPEKEQDEIYNMWKYNKSLYDRNSYIANFYQEYLNNPTLENLYVVFIANYILEGVYFYQGFQYLYTLASRGLCPGTAALIAYINKDEETHVTLFKYIIKELRLNVTIPDTIYKMMEEAVHQEIEFSSKLLGGDKILGMSNKTIEMYTQWLANTRLAGLGLEGLYDSPKNPYRHLEYISGLSKQADVGTKGDFFSVKVVDYDKSSGDWNF